MSVWCSDIPDWRRRRDIVNQTWLRFVPNSFSVARILCGLAFPFLTLEWRIAAILVAALTDALDGLSARWLHVESDTGRLLDPLADKAFVLILAGTLLAEGSLHPLGALGLALRDITVLIGLLYTTARRQWSIGRRMRPSLLGKCTTAAQFVVLLVLVAQGSAPNWLLCAATVLSALAAIAYARAFVRLHSYQASPPANE
jgi:phosphatidylglycerophosphate synthase